MTIMCNIITRDIRALAQQINKSEIYTCNLVSTWQTQQHTAEYPTAQQLKDFMRDQHDQAFEAYLAIPNFQAVEYNPNEPPIRHDAQGNIILQKFPNGSNDAMLEHFFDKWKGIPGLRELIKTPKEAYQFILWREMAFIQRGLDKKAEHRAVCEEDAIKKCKEYRRRNPIAQQAPQQTIDNATNNSQSTPRVLTWTGNWTREEVAAQQDKVFLFGDNTDDRLNTHHIPTSTQAVIRGLPNAIGIDTKKNRGTSEDSYFTDADYDFFAQQLDDAINKAIASGKTIILPAAGIGTGKAQLAQRAPKLARLLSEKLRQLQKGTFTPTSTGSINNTQQRTINTINATIAPYRMTSYNEYLAMTDEQKQHMRRAFYNAAVTLAGALGLHLDMSIASFNIGGYSYNDGNSSIIEPSFTFRFKDADPEQVRLFTILMGDLGYQNQEAVITSWDTEDEQDAAGTRYTLRVNDVDSALQSIKDAGIKNFTLDKQNKTITLLSFDQDDVSKIGNLISLLKDNTDGETEAIPIKSFYDDETSRRDFYISRLEVQEGNTQQGHLSGYIQAALMSLLPKASEHINIYWGSNEHKELSNFAPRPFQFRLPGYEYFTSEGRETTSFPTVEHAFQAAKFDQALSTEKTDAENQAIVNHIQKILSAPTAAEAKRLGGQRRLLSQEDLARWDTQKRDIVKSLIKASFEQNPDAAKQLLLTGEAKLEHRQDGSEWGKMFPKILEEVREELRASQWGFTDPSNVNTSEQPTQPAHPTPQTQPQVQPQAQPQPAGQTAAQPQAPIAQADNQNESDPPEIGIENIEIDKENPRIKAARTFTTIQRTERTNMIAKRFSRAISTAVSRKIKEVGDELNPLIMKPNKTQQDLDRIAQLRDEVALLNDATENRRAVIENYGGVQEIFKIMKEEIEQIVDKSDEELNRLFGQGQAQRIRDEYNKVLDNFDVLCEDAMPMIEDAEHFKIVTKEDKFNDGNGEKTVLSGYVQNTTAQDEAENEAYGDDPEGKRANGNDGWNFKVRFVDPHRSLSQTTKSIISEIIDLDENGRPKRDDLGNLKTMNEEYVHAILINELSDMIDADDFCIKNDDGTYTLPALERIAKKYPWVNQIIEEIEDNPTAISAFYTDFRKEFINYWKQYTREDCKTVTLQLNATNAMVSTMGRVSQNLELGQVLDSDSLYDNSGGLNVENATIGNNNADDALSLLRSFDEEDYDSIKQHASKVFRMLGFPVEDNTIGALLTSSDGVAQLEKALQSAKMIFTGLDEMPEGSNLTSYFREQYSDIANIIGVVTELDYVSSFRQGDKTYYSYSAPSTLDIMIKTLKDDTRRGDYLESRFKMGGKNWWFWNKETGQWRSELLRLLDTDESVRKELEIKELNNIDGKEYEDWDPATIKEAFMREYFCRPINSGSQLQFTYYNCPIFSDSSVAKFIKLPRYISDSQGTFKEKLLPLLEQVVRQEIARIATVKARKVRGISEIVNFDKSGDKFLFFPALNDYDEGQFYANCMAFRNEGDAAGLTQYIQGALEEVMDVNARAFIEDMFSAAGEDEGLAHQEGIERMLESEGVVGSRDAIMSEYSNKVFKEEKAAGEEGRPVNQSLIRSYQSERDNKLNQRQDAIIEALTEYYWNNAFAQTQIIELTVTDIAYFKDNNGVDFQKRYKQVIASGSRLNTNSKYGKKIEKTVYLRDLNMTSTCYQTLKRTLNEAVNKGLIQSFDRDNILYKLKNINATDAQAYRSLPSLRSVLDMMGLWDEETMDPALQNFKDGKWDAGDFNLIWQTLKPFVYAVLPKDDGLGGKMAVPHQNKNSEFILLAMYSIVANSLGKSATMRAINDFMVQNDIDVMQFESAVKCGGEGIVDISHDPTKLRAELQANEQQIRDAARRAKPNDYDRLSDLDIFKEGNDWLLDNDKITQEEYNRRFEAIEPDYDDVMRILQEECMTTDADGNTITKPNVVHEIPYDSYMIAQPTPEHLIDCEQAVFGSQFGNLITSDLPHTMKVNIRGKQYEARELVSLYQAICTENILDDYYQLKGTFDSIEKIQKALMRQVQGNSKYGRDMLDALQIVEITWKGQTKKVFNIPPDSPYISAAIQELICSMFKNHVTKQTLPGGNAIIVSSIGYTDELHVLHDEETGAIKGVECYLPAYSRKFYEPFMVEKKDEKGNSYWELDVKKMPKEMRKLIGYRIPTEAKYSMLPLIIKGFLPQQNGSAIMYPAEALLWSGEDCDVDKKFLFRYHFMTVEYDYQRAKQRYEQINNEIIALSSLFSENSDASVLTQEELKFRDWWKGLSDADKEQYRLETPKIQKIQYDVNKLPQENSRKQRDNMLIDIAWSILTSPEMAPYVQSPGNYDTLKIGARVANIVTDPDKLRAFISEKVRGIPSTGDLDASTIWNEETGEFTQSFDIPTSSEVADTATTILSMMRNKELGELDDFVKHHTPKRDPLSLSTFIHFHQQNVTGGSLIGVYANNTTAQAKLQGVGLDLSMPFRMNGREVKGITDVKSALGELISKNCAEFSAASVDNAKDPVLADLLQNKKTAGITCLMLRAGLSIEEISLLWAFRATFGKDISIEPETMKASDVQKFADAIALNDYSSEMILKTIIIEKGGFTLTPDQQFEHKQNRDAIHALFWALEYMTEPLRELTKISRADSVNGAMDISIAGAAIQVGAVTMFNANSKRKIFGLRNATDVVQNQIISLYELNQSGGKDLLRKRILKSRVPRLQAFYTCGIDFGLDALREVFASASPFMMGKMQYLMMNFDDVEKSTIQDFLRSAVTFALTKTKLFGNDDRHTYEEKRSYYITKYPAVLRKLLEDHPEFKKIDFIRKLKIADEEEGGITFNRAGRLTSHQRESLMRDLDRLLFEEDNPVAQRLALDLFAYAFYRERHNFGPNNISGFFSSNFMSSIPEYVNTLRFLSNDLKQGTFFEEYLPQYILLHPDLIHDISRISSHVHLVGEDGFSIETRQVRNPYTRKAYDWVKILDDVGNPTYYRLSSSGGETSTYVEVNRIWMLNANKTAIQMSKEMYRTPTTTQPAPNATQSADSLDALENAPFGNISSVSNSELDGPDFSFMGNITDDDWAGLEQMAIDPYPESGGQEQLDEPLCL